MRLPSERSDEIDTADTIWRLLEAWDITPANATLERHVVYTFHATYAQRWRAGPILLAGDAAHQMPPFAGQGMCAGIRDAANLAWKLDAVVHGADESLLDTYADERLPSVRTAIEFSVALGEVICLLDPAAARERDDAMSAAVGDGLSEVPEDPPLTGRLCHPSAPMAAHLAPQGVVTLAGQTALLDDLVGAGWRLLTTDADTSGIEPELDQWLSSLGGRVVPVGSVVTDVDDTYATWFGAHRCPGRCSALTSWSTARPPAPKPRTACSASCGRSSTGRPGHAPNRCEAGPAPAAGPASTCGGWLVVATPGRRT
jgi:hypothetical protein